MSYLLSYSNGINSVCEEVDTKQEIYSIAYELEKNNITTNIEIAEKIGSIKLWKNENNEINKQIDKILDFHDKTKHLEI